MPALPGIGSPTPTASSPPDGRDAVPSIRPSDHACAAQCPVTPTSLSRSYVGQSRHPGQHQPKHPRPPATDSSPRRTAAPP
jgi:hypothetical protein